MRPREMAAITLIVPVYNVEKYLIQCLDSVIGQSIPFDEVILINDGSTDKSLSICEYYVSRYNCFKLISQKNKGLSAARNVGLSHAASEYVMFLDSDDCLRSDTVRKLKEELDKFGYDAVYFDADILCESDCLINRNIYDRSNAKFNGIQMSGRDFFLQCYPENYVVSACMAIYKKNVINDIGLLFPEGLYYEDNYFTFMFLNYAECVTYVSEKLYLRRYREDSITTSVYSGRKFTDYIKIVLLIWKEILVSKYIDLSEQGSIFLRFVNDYCRLAFDNYHLCEEQNIILGAEAESYFGRMAEMYELLVGQVHLDEKTENLGLLNQMLRNLQQIISCFPERKKYTEQMLREIIKKQKNCYNVLLHGLPLNIEKYKVGIYGTGNHTEGLIAIYENLIGKITCNLVFVDSYAGNRTYFDREVMQYQQIDKSFDLIIISSLLYRKEMTENVRKMDGKIPICDFYANLKEDVFSGYKIFLQYW